MKLISSSRSGWTSLNASLFGTVSSNQDSQGTPGYGKRAGLLELFPRNAGEFGVRRRPSIQLKSVCMYASVLALTGFVEARNPIALFTKRSQ